MQIRDAHAGDIEAITAIYNDAVSNTLAIWNERTVDAANRTAWLADRERAGYPVLVAIDAEGTVAGYASFGDWRPFEGFRHTVEHSVYVRADRRGAGIGKALMGELIARARPGQACDGGGHRSGQCRLDRPAQAAGFEEVGLMRQVGTKFGAWLDLAFLQLQLDARSDPDGIAPPG